MLFGGIFTVYCESLTERKTQAVVKDLGCDLFFLHPDIHCPVILLLTPYPRLRHCATSQKVAGSIFDGVYWNFSLT
jgi:hypothetical protein